MRLSTFHVWRNLKYAPIVPSHHINQVICPGYILTDINRDYFDTEGGKRMIQRIPQKKLGAIEDLLGPLLLLTSDASRYMTGSVISVDGGHAVSKL